MSLDKLPMAISSRTSRKSLKDRMTGVSVKLENMLDNQYGQTEKRNSMASMGKSKRMSLGESEKDSGFSDTSSEYLSTLEQTDLEDRSSHKRPAALSHTERITAAQSSLPSLTPVYIVKNVFLKEPLPVPSRSQFVQAQLQAWGSQRTLGTPGQARVVFIRQPLAASFKSQKAEAKGGVGIDTYLPILNSYPRIAPHPHKSQDAGSRPTQAGHCLAQDVRTTDHSKSKRLCLGEVEPARNEQTSHVGPVANSESPDTQRPPSFGAANLFGQFDSVSPSPVLSPNPASPSESSESLHSWPSYTSCSSSSSPPPSSSSSNSFTPSVFSCAPSAQSPTGDATRPAARASRPIPCPAKERRFRNTVEILSRSGLLEITLKTKDLIRQNNSAQRQIDELKEHVRLFCSAMQSKEPQALLSLQEAMKGSGSYGSMSSGVSSSSSHL
ncbi:CLOCK-interacting pacemaker-like [Scyliorhinus canicula]|uniref:CLOCK-interacting pacemaker-like n=1 Tax=Scyliorhinus canicula TaxID=7830 RepID=UPI0018F33586|nr:CLOCK-interacting pacemaker-like [Scyliorhinus canicula]XP_038642032.1 CLOCK-interacting pacemaker-like [Scyliorhinus canicula]XP_038642033.1 CLOCK-interacting pacemaker-like [Scyliorhinus canicula]